jgi:hypothetical protein
MHFLAADPSENVFKGAAPAKGFFKLPHGFVVEQHSTRKNAIISFSTAHSNQSWFQVFTSE